MQEFFIRGAIETLLVTAIVSTFIVPYEKSTEHFPKFGAATILFATILNLHHPLIYSGEEMMAVLAGVMFTFIGMCIVALTYLHRRYRR